MFVVKRSHHNPFIVPTKDNLWESAAAFNWCPIRDQKDKRLVHAVYRAIGTPELFGEGGRTVGPEELSVIGYASSKDGIHFENRRKLIYPEYDWEKYGCEDPRVTYFEGKYYIFYTGLSTFPFNAQGIKVAVAITKDFKTIEEKHLVTPFNAKAMVMFPERINGKIVVMCSVNTDMPPAKIAFAEFDDIEDLWNEAKWKNWYANLDEHTIDIRRFPTDHVEVGAPPIKTKSGWLFIYGHVQRYFEQNKIFGIEALVLDIERPHLILGRTKGPLLVPEEIYESYGLVPNVIFPSGAMLSKSAAKDSQKQRLEIYYGAADTTCASAHVVLSDLLESILPDTSGKNASSNRVVRYDGNPILLPPTAEELKKNPLRGWEAKAVFNPATIEIDGTIYLLYRSMSDDNTSTVGLAITKDGLHITERLDQPIYVPRESFEMKRVPGGNSGCEDPRIVRVGAKLYMTYTAYDGIHLPAVAITSISVTDFLARKWNWSKPVTISPSQVDDKDSCLLPEKVNGKYMIIHRVGINVCADFLKTLDFENEKITKCFEVMKPRPGMWDGHKMGIAAPPLKTKKGWLLLYHGISDRSTYRVGAALLDLKNPLEVIARTTDAILSPEMPYELFGQVNNVVFPCGAAIKKDTLYIYYGGADSVVGVATVRLSKLLEVLG